MQRDLVVRSMDGDREAFTELGRIWIDRLYAAARLILIDQHRAEDATQEALLAAWRDLKGLRDPDRFEPWLRRILVNACYREARKDQSWRRAQARVEPAPGTAPDPAERTADRDLVDQAMSGLDPEQRALIVLHFYLRLPVAETALTLGIPAGTVKSRLSRATTRMRANLDAEARRVSAPGGAR
jgi:RNA polymerase sigma-70 factor (ECF subfamily)